MLCNPSNCHHSIILYYSCNSSTMVNLLLWTHSLKSLFVKHSFVAEMEWYCLSVYYANISKTRSKEKLCPPKVFKIERPVFKLKHSFKKKTRFEGFKLFVMKTQNSQSQNEEIMALELERESTSILKSWLVRKRTREISNRVDWCKIQLKHGIAIEASYTT